MTRLTVVLGVLVVVVASVGPVVAHEPPPPAPLDPSDRIEVSYSIELDDETGIVVHATADIPGETVDALAIEAPDGAEVVRTQGFHADNGTYVAVGGQSPAEITYRVPAETPGLALDTSTVYEWAVVERRAIRERVVVNPATGHDPTVLEEFDAAGLTPSFSGTSTTLVGEYDVLDSANPDEQHFRVIVPESVSIAADHDAVLASLASARQQLGMGHRHDDVVAFAVGGQRDADSFQTRGVPEFVVAADDRAEGPDNAWLHQYVHTRQDFSTTPDLRWIYEGTAEYEAALLSLQQGTASWAEFRAEVTTDRYADVDLTDPDADRFRPAARDKGGAAVAVLDARIRRLTDGERSIDAVLRRMNRRNDSIDTSEFEAIVENVTGEEDSGEVGMLVAPDFEPEPLEQPHLFADDPDGDPDGDGIPTGRERTIGTNPFVAGTDAGGAANGTEVDRKANATAAGSGATGETTTSPVASATESTDTAPESTPADEDLGPVRVGLFVVWLALLGGSVWVVRRR